MKPDEEEIGKAANIETTSTGDVYVTFKITSAKWKQKMLESWNKDLEIKIVIEGNK